MRLLQPSYSGITITSDAEEMLYLQPIHRLKGGNPVTGLVVGKVGNLSRVLMNTCENLKKFELKLMTKGTIIKEF